MPPPPAWNCSICCNRTPPGRRIRCPFCASECCRTCLQTYLVSSADDAHCMMPECRRAFDRDTLLSILPRVWVNGIYRQHRESCLHERELAMLPSTTPFVEQERQRRENLALLRTLHAQRAALRVQLRENEQVIRRVASNLTPALDSTSASTFVQRCCVENCRGFLSSAWKCGVCATYSCSACHAPKRQRDDDEHQCDPAAVETVKLLRTDSKKCPSCGIFITKQDGCDQMFCTQCSSAFSWRTGRIVSEGIHNPHYFEALRRGGVRGRNLADTPCGGRPSVRELMGVLETGGEDGTFAIMLTRLVAHITHDELRRYPTEPRHDANRDIRVLYMLNEMSDDEFKAKLQRREKDAQKKRDFGLIMQMLEHTLTDELRRFVIEKRLGELRERALAILAYASEAFASVCRRYECVGPRICTHSMRIV